MTAPDQASFLRDYVANHGNAQQLALDDQIRANSMRLLTLEFDSPEAVALRAVQTELLTQRMKVTIGGNHEK